MKFQKGHIVSEETRNKIKDNNAHYWLGKKRSDETKKKIRLGMTGENNPFWGKHLSESHRKKISESRMGIFHSDETRKKMKGKTPWNKGRKHSPETRKKISTAMAGKRVGDKNPAWRGGISDNPYPPEFNYSLRLKIRTRDNFTCCLCGRTEREELEELNRVLAVNHIDFNKNNCQESNLNTLCLRCNTKINRDREHWTNYFNNIQR